MFRHHYIAESMAVKVNPTRKNFMEAKFIIEHFLVKE